MATKSRTLTLEQLMNVLNIEVYDPDEISVLLKDIVGHEEPKKYLNLSLSIAKDPHNPIFEKATLCKSFFFCGGQGVGKKTTAMAFAKELDLPIIIVNMDRFINEDASLLINNFRKVIQEFSPCVVLFNNIEYTLNLKENRLIILSKILEYLNKFKSCFFITTASVYEETLYNYLLSSDGFKQILSFEMPDISHRKKLLELAIQLYPHDENIDIDRIAKNTLDFSGESLIELLENSYNYAIINNKESIDYETVDAVLSSKLYGYKKKTMSEKERKYTAYHEAGHVVAGYFSDPEYKLSKVEIVNRSSSLGLTIAESDEEKLSYFKEDLINNIILSYGGMAAEKLTFGSTTSGVSQDLAQATTLAIAMVKFYGMSEEFGPISLIDIDDDEEASVLDSTLHDEADNIVKRMLINLYHKTELILTEHKAELNAIAEKLLEKETLYVEEIKSILDSFKKETS